MKQEDVSYPNKTFEYIGTALTIQDIVMILVGSYSSKTDVQVLAEESLVLTFEQLTQTGVIEVLHAFHKGRFYQGSGRNNAEEHLP